MALRCVSSLMCTRVVGVVERADEGQRILQHVAPLSKNIRLCSYILTPRNTVLLEKLTSSQLVKKFRAFYGTWSSLLHLQVPPTCVYISVYYFFIQSLTFMEVFHNHLHLHQIRQYHCIIPIFSEKHCFCSANSWQHETISNFQLLVTN
jgi:hypothetical protein